MKTCVAVDRSLGMCDLEATGRGETGEICWKCSLSLLRNSEGRGRELVGVDVKNSPGRRRLVP